MKNWAKTISGDYYRMYLVWFRGTEIQWVGTNPADAIINDLRSRGIIVWSGPKVGLDDDDSMEAVEIYFIVPVGSVWSGMSDYVMSFPEQEDVDLPSKVVHFFYNIPSDYPEGTLYIRYKDKKIERWRSKF